jgi:hypothetical protein
MGTLVDFRTALRLDLNDPAGASQRFADTDLNRAVARAAAELSLVWPKVTDTELVLASATRTIPLPAGTFPGLISVDEVEYPYGAAGAEATFPPTLPPFRVAPDRASLLLLADDLPAAGARLRVRWTSPHTIAEASTTVPAELDATLALGAAGFAMQAYSTPAADNFKYDDGATVAGVDDSMIPKEWRTRAQAALEQFQSELARLKRARRLDTRGSLSWAPAHEAALWPPPAMWRT